MYRVRYSVIHIWMPVTTKYSEHSASVMLTYTCTKGRRGGGEGHGYDLWQGYARRP
jgi:hypothetical protein